MNLKRCWEEIAIGIGRKREFRVVEIMKSKCLEGGLVRCYSRVR